MRRLPIAVAVMTATLAVSLVGAQSASAALDPVNTAKFRKAVTVDGILAHERALQRIANANDGTRASGTPGFTASASYVKKTMKAAGYSVKEQKFIFPFYRDLAAPTLSQVSPSPADYETNTYQYSGSGDVTGQVVPTNDVIVPPLEAPGSTSGCEASDFVPASATVPQIALIQRGTCTFGIKADNARAAGYDAAIIFNEGQPGRTDASAGTLGDPRESPSGAPVGIPVVSLSYADAAAIYTASQAGPVTLHVTASTEINLEATTSNIIADTPTGNANKVVVVGAHLDSVPAGPGINDNGSGTSTLLEIAEQLKALKVKPVQKVRFIFFGAEESGLLGSINYVNTLPEKQLAKIYANLNFDMLGSPNYARLVYDGDGGGDPDAAGPPGSGQIESLFTDYFDSQNLATEPTPFDGRSDYGPFIDAGIPAGGLFSGAEEIKTPEQAALFGGTAGEPLDRCYHQACDNLNNLNTKALFELGDGAAHAVLTLALSKGGLFEDGSRVASTRAAKAAAPAGSARYAGHVAVS